MELAVITKRQVGEWMYRFVEEVRQQEAVEAFI